MGRLTHTLTSAMRAPHAHRSDAARVVVVDGPDTGMSAVLADAPLIVGSAPDAGLILGDPAVSRHHVEIGRTSAGYGARDGGSKNGTFFEGRRFAELELGAGDRITLGDTVLAIVPNHEPLDPEPAGESSFGAMIGTSHAMRQLFTLIGRVAKTAVTVLVEGDTGVGKELAAREIHARSPRASGPFVTFDCGAVPGELIESALFGHARGAFTGAHADKLGVFQQADGGTIFLDEIGELRPELQPVLLRVLDQRRVRRVGDTDYRPVDVRVVAATHRCLADMVVDGSFREDLYYRLAVLRMTVPSLRERPEDVPLLAARFLDQLGRGDAVIAPDELDALCAHGWPGNVRELRNVIERAVALADGETLAIEIPSSPQRVTEAAGSPAGPLEAYRDAKASALSDFERGYLERLMADHETVTAAAEAAGMDRKHLRTMLRKHKLIDP
jgi:transcriptional regulator with PAS, ATPase and Fis domain